MMHFDRDHLLKRIDLSELADELAGPRTGYGRCAMWPSPVPDHPQTGKSPPMSVYEDSKGVERWKCFATGQGGTAIDLVCVAKGMTVGEAIKWLGARQNMKPLAQSLGLKRKNPSFAKIVPPSPEMLEYIEACAELLWKPQGAHIRKWLVEGRGFNHRVLRLNKIGADPGPRILKRAKGLPYRGPGAVYPALDSSGSPQYLQVRYLHPPPDRGKYDNPTARHGTNPKVAVVEPDESKLDATLITEGIPDALTAACVGYRAIAVMGAAMPTKAMAEKILERAGPLIICFDGDSAGHKGARRLRKLLTESRKDVGGFMLPHGDLNYWALNERHFEERLDSGVDRVLSRLCELSET